jgi:hypothetical protein
MKRKLLSIALGAVFSSSVFAAPIALKPGPVYTQFNNLEQAGAINTAGLGNLDVNGDGVNDLIAGQTENNWGIFNVSSIQAGGVATPNEDISGGTAYFADGFSGGQVHGIFYGLTFTSATTLTGGYIDFYWTDGSSITNADLNGGFAPTNRTGWNAAGKFTAGTLLARLQFQSGAVDGDANTTITSDTDPLNFSGTGQADGFASVMDINNDGVIDASDGFWAASLDSDWFFVDPNGNGIRGEAGETRDLRFSTFFQNLDSWDDGANVQGIRSNDPARAYAVPEPASLALVGAALLGVALSRRRKA